MRRSFVQLAFAILLLISAALGSLNRFESIEARNGEPQNVTHSSTVSIDGTCGAAKNHTCFGSDFGNCCSKHNYCGNISSYCLPTHGCQQPYGTCVDLFPNVTATSMDGQCGNGTTCAGGPWDGACCSAAGYCGYTDEYCQLDPYNCQPAYGKCKQGYPIFSLDGSCGATHDFDACNIEKFGHCCSKSGWCGDGPDYCGLKCDLTLGTFCLSPSPNGRCGLAEGYGCVGSKFGDCCSASGWCGSTPEYCSVSQGCNNRTDGIPFPYLGICTLD